MLRFLLLFLLSAAFVGAVSEPRVVAQDHDPHEHAHDEAGHMHDLDHAHAEEEYMQDYGESVRPQQSMATWYYHSLGLWYSLLLPLTGLFSFALSLVLVIRGGRYAGPTLCFAVPLPLLLAVYAAVTGMVMTFSVIATSKVQPRPSDVAEGISMSLAALVVGFWVALPGLLVALGGLSIRTLIGERPVNKP